MDQIQQQLANGHIIWVYFLAPSAVLVAAFFAYIGVRKTLLESRQQSKDRATLEYIMKRNSDDRFFDCFKIAVDVDANDDLDIRKYASEEEKSSKEAKDLQYILNQYEYLSVGIRNNTYNEKMLKDAIFSTTVRLFEITAPYISRINTNNRRNDRPATAYCEFEWLAKKWKDEGNAPPAEKEPLLKRLKFWSK